VSQFESGPFNEAAYQALERTSPRRRVLDVACLRNHRLCEVFRTDAGFVVVGDCPHYFVKRERDGGEAYDPEYGVYSWEHESEARTQRSRAGTVYCFVDDLVRRWWTPATGSGLVSRDYPGAILHEVDAEVKFQCKCSSAKIGGLWLRRALASSRRRVPYNDVWSRTR